jgi:hypothetical protein
MTVLGTATCATLNSTAAVADWWTSSEKDFGERERERDRVDWERGETGEGESVVCVRG